MSGVEERDTIGGRSRRYLATRRISYPNNLLSKFSIPILCLYYSMNRAIINRMIVIISKQKLFPLLFCQAVGLLQSC